MGTSRLVSQRRNDQGLKWTRIGIAVLATVGVIDTSSITLKRWGWLGSLTCPGGGDGCDKVLNSAWGTVFQANGFVIPLSFIGAIAYIGIFIMAIFPLFSGLVGNKFDLARRTWWGLFLTSCGMSVFSILLMWLMIVKIEAFCFFCLLSACLSIAILILSLIGGGWDDYGKLLFRGILMTLAVLLGGLIWISALDPNSSYAASNGNVGSPPIVRSFSGPSQVSLAKHLTEVGAVMYSAYWCPHCHDQKELFGKEAVEELVVVECALDGINSQHALCNEKGITGFPAWEINGEIDSGVHSLQELAKLSNYKGPRKF